MSLRLLVLLLLLMLSSACSYGQRQFWGKALQGTADRIGSTHTTYCTTTYRHGVAYTSCY